MAKKRLPNPGKDEGVWGSILNDYLRVSHDDTGGLYVINSDTDRNKTFKEPVEGQVCFNKEAGQFQRYNGKEWENITENVKASTLGSAAFKEVGTGAGQVLVVDNDGKLPGLDGSNLSNVTGNIEAWDNAAGRPSNPGEGLTGINKETSQVEKWNGTAWENVTDNAKKTELVPPVDDLAALKGLAPMVGQKVQLLSFSPNNPAGGIYEWDPQDHSSTNTAGRAIPNDADVIAPTSDTTGATGAWVRVSRKEMVVSVLDYGADPTGVNDSSEAFNQALAEYRNVYVPEGNYLVKQPIFIQQSDTRLFGSGANSAIRVDNSGWYTTPTLSISGRVLQAATIPTSGAVTLKIEGAYNFAVGSTPHAGLTPITGVPNPTSVLCAKGKYLQGTLSGVNGKLRYMSRGIYTFTPDTYPGSPVSVSSGDIFTTTALINPLFGAIMAFSLGLDDSASRTIRNIRVENLAVYSIKYATLASALGSTTASTYDNVTWKGGKRIPKCFSSDHVDGVTLQGCYFFNSAHEAVWPAGNGSGRSNNFSVLDCTFRNCGYEVTGGTALPSLQCNFQGGRIVGNFIYQAGTGIGGSGSDLIIANNVVKGFILDGISWGDDQRYGVTITGNVVINEDTLLPAGAVAANITSATALNGYVGYANVPLYNMVMSNNTVTMKGVKGTGIKVRSTGRSVVENNKIFIDTPLDNVVEGIRVQNTTANSTQEVYLSNNKVFFTGVANTAQFLPAMRVTSESSGAVTTIYSEGDRVSGLVSGNTAQYAIHTGATNGGSIIYSARGFLKSAGLMLLPKFHGLYTFPNNELITFYVSTANTGATELALDSSKVNTFSSSLSVTTGNSVRFYRFTTLDNSPSQQGSGLILCSLQFGSTNKNKLYIVDSAFGDGGDGWYAMTPLFSTGNITNGQEVDLIMQKSSTFVTLAAANYSGVTQHISCSLILMSGFNITITKEDPTAFANPTANAYNRSDNLMRVTGAATVSASTPSTHKLPIRINGTTYYILLSNV